MAPRPTTPRLAPIPQDQWTDVHRELIASSGRGRPLNIFTTLLHHPGLMRRWLPFGGKLLNAAKLPPRDREMVILRAAFLCGSAYEWGQHVSIGRDAGLTNDEIIRVGAGPDAEGWAGNDTTLLRAVDELHEDHCITDATWAALVARYTTEQVMEVPMLAGAYAMLAGVLNSCGVQLEGDAPALGQA